MHGRISSSQQNGGSIVHPSQSNGSRNDPVFTMESTPGKYSTPNKGSSIGRNRTSDYGSINENDDNGDTRSPGSEKFNRTFSSGSSAFSPVSSPPWSPSDPRLTESRPAAYASPEQIKTIKDLLVDFEEENDRIISRNTICPNTRTKLLQAVEAWFRSRDQNASKVMVMTGAPGVGKTCFSAEVCRQFNTYIGGCHFFDFRSGQIEHNLATNALKGIYTSIGKVVPEIFHNFASQPKIETILSEDDVVGIFNAMIKSLPATRPKRVLIVIDAVDECDYSQREELLKVINEFDRRSPDWLYLFATLVNDGQLTIQLDSVSNLVEVDEKGDAMHADLKRYFRNSLLPYFDVMTLDGSQARVLQHCKGNFLNANLILKKLETLPQGTRLTVRDCNSLPQGLDGIYKECFQALLDYLSSNISLNEAADLYMKYVGLLVTAQEPIHKSAFNQLHNAIDVDEALHKLAGCIEITSDNLVGLSHKDIYNWLTSSDGLASNLIPDLNQSRIEMAKHVMDWLQIILEGTSKQPVDRKLEEYALKHGVFHIVEASEKYGKDIAKILCSLNYIDEKLKLVDYRVLLKDYSHSHYLLQQADGDYEMKTLENSLSEHPDTLDWILEYRQFMEKTGKQLRPGFVAHQAANFPNIQSIQNLAKDRLVNLPWIQDLTKFKDSTFEEKKFKDNVCNFDVSPDGNFIVVMTGRAEADLHLHIMRTEDIDTTLGDIDLTHLIDRYGYSVKILANNTNVFMGSLKQFINLNTGEFIHTDFDLSRVPIKEQYEVECCDSVAKIFCCAVSTIPFGGRNLHMVVIDLDLKKCLTTLDIAKFDEEVDVKFGTRACALSSDGTMLTAFVKQSHHSELKGMIWSTYSWRVMRSVTVGSDLLTKCYFLDSNNIIISSGVRGSSGRASGVKDVSYLWTIHMREAVAVNRIDSIEKASISHAKSTQLITVQWFQFNQHARLSRWKKWVGTRPADQQAMIYGLDDKIDISTTENLAIFTGKNSVRVYRLADLDQIQPVNDKFSVTDAIVSGCTFVPRSEDMVITYRSTDKNKANTVTVAYVRIQGEGEFQLTKQFTIDKNMESMETLSRRFFTNQFSCLGICRLFRDVNHGIICTGSEIHVIEMTTGAKKNIQYPDDVRDSECILCGVSPREIMIAAVYSTAQDRIYIHDVFNPNKKPLLLQPPDSSIFCSVSDLSFLPSNGHLASYYTGDCNVFVVWNIRSGAVVSYHSLDGSLLYSAISTAFDKLALILSLEGYESVLLRNADNTSSSTLMLPVMSAESGGHETIDVEFTTDGTLLLGMFARSHTLRIWNSFTGDNLVDLPVSSQTPAEIIGMVTNTHVLLGNEKKLEICDIGAGDTLAVTGADDSLPEKLDSGSFRMSPQGKYIVGVTGSGGLKAFQIHNVTAVKFNSVLPRV